MVNIEAEEMTVTLEGDLTIECDNMGMETAGDGNVKASGSITLEGQSVGIN